MCREMSRWRWVGTSRSLPARSCTGTWSPKPAAVRGALDEASTQAPMPAPKLPRPHCDLCCVAGQRRGGVSRPVGRVLCTRLRGAAAIHLGLPLPAASCGLPASIGRATLDRSRREPLVPLLTLLRVGFTEPPQSPAALVVSYTAVSPLPRVPGRGAVCFLWHCPAGHPGSVLPTTLPCGARTFLTGPAPGATARPTHPTSRIRSWSRYQGRVGRR
jgi:hypothetical protein